jgi:hypothetical protein
MGVPWGAPDDLNTFMAMVNNVPSSWTFSAFSIGRNQMPIRQQRFWPAAMSASVWKTISTRQGPARHQCAARRKGSRRH